MVTDVDNFLSKPFHYKYAFIFSVALVEEGTSVPGCHFFSLLQVLFQNFPARAHVSQNIMVPPLCFTVKVVCSGGDISFPISNLKQKVQLWFCLRRAPSPTFLLFSPHSWGENESFEWIYFNNGQISGEKN